MNSTGAKNSGQIIVKEIQDSGRPRIPGITGQPVYVQSIYSMYRVSVETIGVLSEARLIGGKEFKRMIIQNLKSALEGVFVLILKLTL